VRILHLDAADRRPRHARRPAFTLIELLTVVSIVVLLIAILLPVIGGVRAQGRRVACAANLHQIGLGVALYAVDHHRALPTHEAGAAISFDTVAMRRDDGEFVNLGLLVGDYVIAPKTFYCPTQTRRTSPCLAFDTPENGWKGQRNPSGGGGGGGGPGGGGSGGGGPGVGAMGMNSSFAARSRADAAAGLPAWTLPNYINKVIYSDFLGVDDWPGRGRFAKRLCAPHNAQGYNRLFGDGSVAWAPAAKVNTLRPVGEQTPTAHELRAYYQLLDVLP